MKATIAPKERADGGEFWSFYYGSLVETVVKTAVAFVPTVPRIVTAATATREAIRAYSIIVTPFWDLM
jgi:hypothetical protein